MDTIFVTFLGVVLGGCLLAEGAVMGAGMHVFSTDRRRVATSIGPLFLATEVWFVALIGLVAGAFPAIEAALLTTAYPLLALFLFSWVLRDAALWFGPRISSVAWQRFWGTVLGVASIVMSAALGAVLGTALAGGAAGGHHAEFDLSRLASPPVWVCAILLPVVLAWHGGSFLRWRTGQPSGRRGGLTSVVTLAIAAAVVTLGAGTLTGSLVSHPSAVVIATIAAPVFAVMIGVQVLWWWVAGQQRAVTEFFAWRRTDQTHVAASPYPQAGHS